MTTLQLTAFSNLLNTTSDVCGTNLVILRAVEKTVDNLCKVQRSFESLSQLWSEIIPRRGELGNNPIDPEDVIVARFHEVELNVQQDIDVAKAKRRSAFSDSELNGVHEESVVSEYDRTVSAMEEFLYVLNETRIAITEHDADCDESVNGPFDNIDDLMASLNDDS